MSLGAWVPKRHATGTSAWYRKGTVGDANLRLPSGATHADVVRFAIMGIQRTLRSLGYGSALSVTGAIDDAWVRAIRDFQTFAQIGVDGIFGRVSATALFRLIAADQEAAHSVPDRLVYGVLSLESGFDPGALGANGFDTGVAQWNLDPVNAHGKYVTVEQACDPMWAIPATAVSFADSYRTMRPHLDRLLNELAVASHNGPRAAMWRRVAMQTVPPGIDGINPPSGWTAEDVARSITINAEYARLVYEAASR